MNIFEFCERYHISPTKARRMESDGALNLDNPSPEIDPLMLMHQRLARGQALTAAQLCELVDDPGMISGLGRYADKARAQLAALGTIEPAPKLVAAYVTDAAKNDPEAVDALLIWLRATIPARPVSHSYIAVRLLLGLAPNIRHYDAPRIPRALLNCRKREEFSGWWKTREIRKDHNETVYQKPRIANLDL